MILTIDIKDNNKANAVLEYLKSLNFVTVETRNDWSNSLDEVQAGLVNEGLQDLANKHVSTYDEVKEKAKKVIAKKK